MCGIAGVLSLGERPLDADRLKPMVDVIAHRGPNDAGYLVWKAGRGRGKNFCALADREFHGISPDLPVIDSAEGKRRLNATGWNLFLGHRRLAIIDLSPRGHQPMSNREETVWVAHNGEIYNFRELRTELKACGHSFVSRSDTEVLVQAYEEWGIDCVRRFNGMFAFALWDARKELLHLVRDRYGVKPLYYLHDGDTLVFASEIKSILQYLPKRPEVDLLALNEYFSFQNIFSSRTLFEGIRLLPPATVLTLNVATGLLSAKQYWEFDFSREDARPETELREELYHLIGRAVERQCVSDVPIGTYLSGGMDSGTVAAITRKILGRTFSFTAGFDLSEAAEHEMRFDERELAEKMAASLQTEHYECVLHAGDMEACLEKLVWHLEDLRMGQCYPNWYVARLAGKFVKVVMSGAGGDELFGGYPWRYAAAVGDTHQDYVQNYYRYWQRLVSNAEKQHLFRPEIAERLRGLDEDGAVPFRDHTFRCFRRVFGREIRPQSLSEQVVQSLYFECKTFLPGLLLVEDKLSMAHSLETRVPFLDNELVDFACRIPIRYKVAGVDHLERIDENLPRKKGMYQEKINAGKVILRGAMEKILPPEVTKARKQGFSAPDESWFRGRGEQYVRHELLKPDARICEYLDPKFVQDTLDLHASGRANKRLLVWSMLCLEKWLGTLPAFVLRGKTCN